MSRMVVVAALACAGVATSALLLLRRSPPDAAGALPAAFASSPAGVPDFAAPGGVDDAQSALVALANSVRPTVVSIRRRSDGGHLSPQAGLRFVDPYPDGDTRVGTGVVVDERGYVLTSGQVAGRAREFLVTLPGPPPRQARARRAADDPGADLVLLHVSGVEGLPALPLGDSDGLKMGDIVLAFGTPFGFGSTTTFGIVASNRRDLTVEGHTIHHLIQTDVRLNPGDSGGPLVNIAGELIGVNVAVMAMNSAFAGIGFAVPSNRVRELLARL